MLLRGSDVLLRNTRLLVLFQKSIGGIIRACNQLGLGCSYRDINISSRNIAICTRQPIGCQELKIIYQSSLFLCYLSF